METVGEAAKKALDSLKQENQEKLTGPVDTCAAHDGVRLREKRDYSQTEGCVIATMVCPMCEEKERERERKEYHITRCHRNLALPSRLAGLSFDGYKTASTKQAKALIKCQEYAKGVVDNKPGGLIMLGGVGTGKTHLAVAICKAVCDAGMDAHLTSVPKIIRAIRSTWGKVSEKTEEAVLAEYSEYRLLVIDEIGIQYGSDSEKISISEVINERYNQLKPTVIIGNVTMSEAGEFLGARVLDRIKDQGVTLFFDWESARKLA